MIVLQKFYITTDQPPVKRFICVAANVSDMEAAILMGTALSTGWAPTTPEEGIYIYDPTTNIAAHKYVNGIQVW